MATTTIQIILLICPLICVLSKKTATTKKVCDQLLLENEWYNKKVLISALDSPHYLVYHKASDNVFFVHSVSNYYSSVDFQIAHYNLLTRDLHNIKDVTGGCAIAIDEVNNVIYLGGDDGIFKYNIGTKTASFYKQNAVNIWALIFRKNLFYISYPDQKLHVEVRGQFAAIKDFDKIEVDNFLVTKNNDIYSANKSGVFKFDYQSKKSVRIIIATVRQITEDRNGDVYFSTNKGLFKTISNLRRKKISNASFICGITFTSDNTMIISDENSLMRLEHTTEICKNNVSQLSKTKVKPSKGKLY